MSPKEPDSRFGRVGMWRGGCRLTIAVSAPFVWRCLSGSAMAPFPHSAHRTGRADFPHPALGQDLTPLFDPRRHLRSPNPLARFTCVVAVAPPWVFPFCVRFPCVHAVPTTPAQRLGAILPSFPPSRVNL